MSFRLDFMEFNIRGPETTNNQCVYDQFIVSGGNPVPTICGSNTGNHSTYKCNYNKRFIRVVNVPFVQYTWMPVSGKQILLY